MTGAITQPPSEIGDLRDALTRVASIFQAANALAYEIGRNGEAAKALLLGLDLGPVDGLTWAMGELGAAIRQARSLAQDMSG